MYCKLATVALLLAASPFAFAAQSSNGNADAAHSFSKTVSAAGLTSIKFDTKVGNIHITAANTDTVSIKATAVPSDHMHFIFDWTIGPSANELPAGLHLVARREGTQLVISLATGAGSTAAAASADNGHDTMNINIDGHSNWKTNWTLTLPARLALDLTVGVGKAEVVGLAGGLRANIGVGKLDLQLPQGPVDASVGVGNIKTAITSADYGKVNLTAGVGRIEFDINGRTNGTGYEKHFTSAKQQVNGPGKTDYTLKAGVGHVYLYLGVKNMPKSNDENAQDNQ